jgi:hypothetical protein
MKKALSLLLFMALALPVSAEIRISLGANAGYDLQFFTEVQPPTREIITQVVEAGIFFDATYLRLDVNYAFTPMKPLSVKTDDIESAPSRPDDFWKMQLVQVGLLGKFPIPIATMTVWPSLGILYSTCRYLDHDGDGDNDVATYDSLNDFYLIGGVGVDFPIAAGIFITAGAFFDFNLTPSPDKDYTATYTWYDFKIKVGAGFRL